MALLTENRGTGPAVAASHHDLIRYAAGLRYDALPADVIAEARRLLLDTIGCIVAAKATEAAPVIDAAARAFGAGAAARTYGLARLADLMDFNEGYAGAHFGCGAVAAVLALAGERPMSGRMLLTAIVAGFETGARVMDAMGPYYTTVDGKKRFAPVWGIATPVTYAAVAAAVQLLGLEGEMAIEAFSLAGANSPIPVGGKWSEAVDLPNTKYCDAGWAALAGLMGAVAAGSGSTGHRNLLDDDRGLITILGAVNGNPAKLSADLGTQWHLRNVIYKEWPCCGLVYGPLTLARKLVTEEGIAPDAIEAIAVGVDPAILIPRFVNPAPKTLVSLQFSLPHNLAMVLRGVPPGPLWQARDLAEDPESDRLRRLASVTEYRPAATGPAGLCSLEIRVAGKVHRRELFPEPVPTRRAPDGDEGMIAKFRAQVAEPQADRIIRSVMGIESLGSLDALISELEQAVAR